MNQLLRNPYRFTIIQHFVIILMGASVFYVDWKVVDNAYWVKIVLLLMTAFKVAYFLFHNFFQLMEAVRKNRRPPRLYQSVRRLLLILPLLPKWCIAQDAARS